MRVVLVAEEGVGARALRLVLASPHRLVAVLSRDQALARDHDVPVLDPGRVTDPAFAAELDADVLLNVHALHVVHPAVLAAPGWGCVNLHPGPLPGYAGRNVASWAVYHGERTHAVTLHRMTPQVDAGPIVYESRFDLTPRATGLTVSATCARLGLALVERLLTALATDPAGIPAIPQDPRGRRYFGRHVPHDGWVPWDLCARRVAAFVRACDHGPFPSPWGRPRTRAAAGVVTIGRVEPTGEPTLGAVPGTVGCSGTEVAAADSWVRVRARPAVLRDGEVLSAALAR